MFSAQEEVIGKHSVRRCILCRVGCSGTLMAVRKWITEHPNKQGQWTPAEASLSNVAGGKPPESGTFRVIINDWIKVQLI